MTDQDRSTRVTRNRSETIWGIASPGDDDTVGWRSGPRGVHGGVLVGWPGAERQIPSPAPRGALVMASSLPRAVSAWSVGLLVFVVLAAGCTSAGQAPPQGHGPWEGQGPSPGQGPSEGQGPREGHGPDGHGPPQDQGRGGNDVVTLPVGGYLPSGQECAARVQRDQPEPRPENTSANQVVPDRVTMPVWKDFTEQANQQFVSRIDGKFTGTTRRSSPGGRVSGA